MFVFPAGGDPNLLGATIGKSVRFDGVVNFFSRSPGSTRTDARKGTVSLWVKRTATLAAGSHPLVATYYDGNNHETFDFLNDGIWYYAYHGALKVDVRTTSLFRDVGQWYHVVLAIDTSQATGTDRVKLWVNGVQEALTFNATPALDYNLYLPGVSGGWTSYIGAFSTSYLNGNLAELHICDGYAYDASYFGATCTHTGEWVPKSVSGVSYGNNGCYLSFANASTATTLGYDDAGSNDWTPTGISVTAGFDNDSLLDTPTTNYCTFSYVSSYYNTKDGGLRFQGDSSTVWYSGQGTMAMLSGKWYCEFKMDYTGAGVYWMPGILPSHQLRYQSTYPGAHVDSYGYINSGDKYNNALNSAYGNTFTAADVIGVAFDADNGKLWFSKNGVWQASGDPAAGTNAAFTSIDATLGYVFACGCYGDGVSVTAITYAEFGQRAFSYTPPAGFKALNARNIAKPTLKDGSKYFDTKLYTGNGSTQSITGLGFQPDLVWVKSRSNTRSHRLYDAVRGATKEIYSDDVAIEYTEANGLTAFNADGFSIGSALGVNANTETFVAWNFKESVDAGIDIVSYTGNGSNRAIAHSLGKVPACMIIKNRNGANSWRVYHKYANATPAAYALYLDVDWAATSEATAFNSTAPTATEFTVGTHAGTNNSGDPFIAYLFAEIPGFSRIGKYLGNSVAEGPFVHCGFRPAFLMTKRVDVIGSWLITDSTRRTYNPTANNLWADSTAIETTTDRFDFVSNGFKVRSTNADENGGTHVFIAFAESPFKYNRAR